MMVVQGLGKVTQCCHSTTLVVVGTLATQQKDELCVWVLRWRVCACVCAKWKAVRVMSVLRKERTVSEKESVTIVIHIVPHVSKVL